MLMIHVEGSAYERGRQTGKAFPLAVWRVAIEAMRSCHTSTHDMDALGRKLDRGLEALAEASREDYECLRGLADGSTAPLRNLFAVRYRDFLRQQEDGCTVAGFQDTPRGPVVGGNVDDPGWHYLSVEKPDSGYAYIAVSLPGYAGKWGGMNEHGLCITGAGASTAKPKPRPPDPVDPERYTFMRGPVRDVLTYCRTTDEALEFLRKETYADGNHVVGDADTVVQVENRCEFVYRAPDDAPLCVGNLKRSEFEDPSLDEKLPHLPESIQNRAARNRLLKSLMERYSSEASPEAMIKVLTGHGDDPDGVRGHISICNQGTSVSLVGVPREKRVWSSRMAPPCVHGYEEYSLETLLQQEPKH